MVGLLSCLLGIFFLFIYVFEGPGSANNLGRRLFELFVSEFRPGAAEARTIGAADVCVFFSEF